jgi:hypothetical protein
MYTNIDTPTIDKNRKQKMFLINSHGHGYNILPRFPVSLSGLSARSI